MWPFNTETSAFWQPLGLLCAAAAVRAKVPHVDVQVWDAPGQEWGWPTLQGKLAEAAIDVLGIGEETCSAHEGLRAAGLVKQIHPNCVVVAGGVHFAHCLEPTLADGRVDVIVRGEAEETLPELLAHLDDRDAWASIPGLAFRQGPRQLADAAETTERRLAHRDSRRVVLTPTRRLIENLDTLPLPAYDLIDMSRYGRASRNHPGLVSIEHSRGCIDSCSFCILWKHMGRPVNGNGIVRPCYRTKSGECSFEEVMWLYRRFDRRTFGWVDPTFNASPDWSDRWAERMLASDLVAGSGRPKTIHTAWLRADCVIRDEKLGILDKLVRAGLRQVMLGLERDDRQGMEFLGKHNNDPEVCREAIAVFREKYPRVYTIGSVVFGLPGDTRDDLNRLMRWQDRLGLDYCFFIPLTPNPGTEAARAVADGGCLAREEQSRFDFHTPVCRTRSLDLRELESMYWRTMLRPSASRLTWAIRECFFQRDRRKRRVGRALFCHGMRVALAGIRRAAFTESGSQPFTSYSRKPSWYDT